MELPAHADDALEDQKDVDVEHADDGFGRAPHRLLVGRDLDLQFEELRKGDQRQRCTEGECRDVVGESYPKKRAPPSNPSWPYNNSLNISKTQLHSINLGESQ